MATTEATLSEEIEVDWADLPVDMLQNISKKLHDIAEFIYFRAVCKRWRTATSISDPPPLIPWLLEKPDRRSGVLRFYSLFSDKVRTVPCPQSLGKSLSGPSRGYLCATDGPRYDKNYYLVNPLTKHEVKIPITQHFTRPIMRVMGPDPMKNNHMFFLSPRKFATDEDENYLMGEFGTDEDENDLMGFYQPLSREWSYVKVPVEMPRHGIMPQGEACLNGLFYLSRVGTEATRVVDIASGTSHIILPPKNDYGRSLSSRCSLHVVESAGKILRIVRNQLERRELVIFFDIHELDLEGENGQARWIETSCIGDQVLFLDDHNIGISVTASDSTGLKGNCIYYFRSFRDYSRSKVRWYKQACRYNIANGRSESTRCPFNSAITWFVPSVTGFLPGGPH